MPNQGMPDSAFSDLGSASKFVPPPARQSRVARALRADLAAPRRPVIILRPARPLPMNIRLFNTLTGQKEPLDPILPGRFRMYVCGPTVYDFAHLGHGRCYIVYDVLARHLRARGPAMSTRCRE